ncbi:hypothetical protein NDU88_000901 [Pleurodeles waltl]|uniref:Uncharacterized protein n=1 Tax=Pleurodeles waltl TaxID=8319 RepID=A0AAV7VYK3_PLEWA|nr:hypothetical protein NDU88_000901 [Pleurodeles waltl]
MGQYEVYGVRHREDKQRATGARDNQWLRKVQVATQQNEGPSSWEAAPVTAQFRKRCMSTLVHVNSLKASHHHRYVGHVVDQAPDPRSPKPSTDDPGKHFSLLGGPRGTDSQASEQGAAKGGRYQVAIVP